MSQRRQPRGETPSQRLAAQPSPGSRPQRPAVRNHPPPDGRIPRATHTFDTPADIEWADAVIFGTPSRFGNVSSQLKRFMNTSVACGGLAEIRADGTHMDAYPTKLDVDFTPLHERELPAEGFGAAA